MQSFFIFNKASFFCLMPSILQSFFSFAELSLFDLFERIKVVGVYAIALYSNLVEVMSCGVKLLDTNCVSFVHESNKNIEGL